MGFFDIITNPIRGIGRILRGNVKEGLHDITDSAAKAAPIVAWVPGVGPVTAGVMGGIGKLGEELTDEDAGVNPMSVLGSAAGAYGSGAIADSVGGVGGIKSGIGKILGGGGGEAVIEQGAKQGAQEIAKNQAQKQGMDSLTKIALGSNIAGSAANAYGAHQMGKAEDRRVSMEEEELQRRREREESLDPMRAELLKMLMGSLRGAEA